MIATITRGSSAMGLAQRLHRAGPRGGVVIGGSVPVWGATDGRKWARTLDRAASKRRDVPRPIWHCSLRAAPGDPRLSDQDWQAIAAQFVEEIGLPERLWWVAVRHDDDSVHIAVSRVSDTGELWAAKNDYAAAERACRAIEAEFGLLQVPSPPRTEGGRVRRPAGAKRPLETGLAVDIEGRSWRVAAGRHGQRAELLGQDGWRPVKGGLDVIRAALAARDAADQGGPHGGAPAPADAGSPGLTAKTTDGRVDDLEWPWRPPEDDVEEWVRG